MRHLDTPTRTLLLEAARTGPETVVDPTINLTLGRVLAAGWAVHHTSLPSSQALNLLDHWRRVGWNECLNRLRSFEFEQVRPKVQGCALRPDLPELSWDELREVMGR